MTGEGTQPQCGTGSVEADEESSPRRPSCEPGIGSPAVLAYPLSLMSEPSPPVGRRRGEPDGAGAARSSREREPMKITEILAAGPSYSFEFFPPKTPEAAENLAAALADLEPLAPSFASVTYGAGGGTREMTHEIVTRLHRESSVTAMAHLTCVCHTRAELVGIVGRYRDAGIENILALGGDPPKNQDLPPGELDHADRPRPARAGRGRLRDRRGRVPRAAPEGREPGRRPAAHRREARRWPTSRSRSSSSTPATTSTWSRRCASSASTSR